MEGGAKMKKRRLRVLVLCLLLVGFAWFNSPSFGQVKPIELNFSSHMPAAHSYSLMEKEWTKEIEKRTNGRVKITYIPGGTLLPADKCYDGVVKGIADVGNPPPSNTRGRFPLAEILEMPLGYRIAMEGTLLMNDWYRKFKPKEYAEVQVMYFQSTGPVFVHSKKPITKFEDFKGMKMRSTGLATIISKAIGAAPVGMPVVEAYDALKKGVAEASLAPFEALEGFRWGEVLKFSTIFNCAWVTGWPVVMNKSKWNLISPDDQKIIEKINEEWIIKQGKNWTAIDDSGKKFLTDLGGKILYFSNEDNEKMDKAVAPLFDDYVKRMKELGLPGEESLNFCRERLKQLH
jgi:TRAP-type C4-dicarboxylate transport system substrate-binding protein